MLLLRMCAVYFLERAWWLIHVELTKKKKKNVNKKILKRKEVTESMCSGCLLYTIYAVTPLDSINFMLMLLLCVWTFNRRRGVVVAIYNIFIHLLFLFFFVFFLFIIIFISVIMRSMRPINFGFCF
jgi:hypothetical protein